LKPQNIMLTKKKEKGGSGVLLKIADLGVSAQLARVFTTTQIGTPHYMAPGERLLRRPDSYSWLGRRQLPGYLMKMRRRELWACLSGSGQRLEVLAEVILNQQLPNA
jgi:serine/threonine protein kinase